MTAPTTKADLLDMMQAGHQEFYFVLSRIPDERMEEVALYDNWSIKDLIAHIGSWQKSLAERVEALRQGKQPYEVREDDVDGMNAEFLAQYRDVPLNEVRLMEAASFTAVERQVIDASESELFEANHFPSHSKALVYLIAGDTYDHYPEHLEDVQDWMRRNGLE